jgi:hypothetical protein
VHRDAIYWALISLAGIAACLAHFWIDGFGDGTPFFVERFLPACAFLVLYCLAYRFAGSSRKRICSAARAHLEPNGRRETDGSSSPSGLRRNADEGAPL